MRVVGGRGKTVLLDQGQTVTVVVDGIFESIGDFTLGIERLSGMCPDEEIEGTVGVQ